MTIGEDVVDHNSQSHELLYFVSASLVGDDPKALRSVLEEHLEFLADLDRQGRLVFAGPLETPEGSNTGHAIYAIRAATLFDAEEIVGRDPMHRASIRFATVSRWNRRIDWNSAAR